MHMTETATKGCAAVGLPPRTESTLLIHLYAHTNDQNILRYVFFFSGPKVLQMHLQVKYPLIFSNEHQVFA